MSDANKVADAEKLDKILTHLDSMNKRMDAMEATAADSVKRVDAACERMDSYAKKADAEEEERKKADAAKADAARKDAEEEERKKADKARADADEEAKKADAARIADAARGTDVIAQMRAEIDALKSLVPPSVTPDLRQRMVAHQRQADRVASAFGDAAGAPVFSHGETEAEYTVRLLKPYLKFSKKWKEEDLVGINDSALAKIEAEVYADAIAESVRPTQFQRGHLIPITNTDAANRRITHYVGDPNACWDQFNPTVRHVRRILTPGASRVQ